MNRRTNIRWQLITLVQCKHVHNSLLDNQIITPFHSGFTRGDSTVNQLVDIYNIFCQTLDEGKEAGAVFCDISKVFDRVWHRGLIAKLIHYDIIGPPLALFESYLTNRRQRVVLPNCNSDWREIKPGLPQGSILGPLLFIVYILLKIIEGPMLSIITLMHFV